MSKREWIKSQYNTALEAVERGLDKHIRIAVTGLSRSGKTAFITSFINQLLFAVESNQLPAFELSQHNRLLGTKLQPYDELHIPEFKYKESMQTLTASEPQWPPSTSSIAQSQIKLKYKNKKDWFNFSEDSHLTIDIVDYPGEWLLDLPLLRMSFKQWSKQCADWVARGHRQSLAKEWIQASKSVDAFADYDEEQLAKIAEKYREFLHECKKHKANISLIQPGRFILPGELAGAPVLDFFPIIDDSLLNSEGKNKEGEDKDEKGKEWQDYDSKSNLALLEKRFNYYRDKVVRPFFEEYFSKVDRQVLLVDCLSVLNSGYDSYLDMQFTLSELLKSFHYGQSNWIKRLFNPSIDKLMLAATKSDHVPPEQHKNLESFMQNMLQSARQDISYEGIEMSSIAISSINVTQPVMAEHQGKSLMCVKGKELSSKEMVVNYPGNIPSKPLTRQQWEDLEFDFVEFAVADLESQSLPHIRMDGVLQFLLGDKFS